MPERPLTAAETTLLRRYATGHQVADIATAMGQDRERIGLALVELCALNRTTARAAVQRGTYRAPSTAPVASRTPIPRPEPEPEPAEIALLKAGLEQAIHERDVARRFAQQDHRAAQAAIAERDQARAATATTGDQLAAYRATWCPGCGWCGPAGEHESHGHDLVPATVTITRAAP